jgi:hypothetical protein
MKRWPKFGQLEERGREAGELDGIDCFGHVRRQRMQGHVAVDVSDRSIARFDSHALPPERLSRHAAGGRYLPLQARIALQPSALAMHEPAGSSRHLS